MNTFTIIIAVIAELVALCVIARLWIQRRMSLVPRILVSVLFFVVILATISFCGGASPILTNPLPVPNPTSYLFPLPVAEVHDRALLVFSIEHQIDQPIFGHVAEPSFESTLDAECASNAFFGKAIFRVPANAQDIYLYTFHAPFVISSVYAGKKGGLPFIATFHLHLAASGTNTTVTVIADKTEVINGTKFGFGPCGFGQGNVYVSVRPTTIEEYTILRYLGGYLGLTNMPEVIKPKI